MSHSHADSGFAAALVGLIAKGLQLRPNDIRLTSHDDHTFAAGDDIDEKIRDEVLSCDVLIGVISRASQKSAYVMAELGARWGADKPIAPIVIGDGPFIKKAGPIAALKAVDAGNERELRRLVKTLAEVLGSTPTGEDSISAEVAEVVRRNGQQRMRDLWHRVMPVAVTAGIAGAVAYLFWPASCDYDNDTKRVTLIYSMAHSDKLQGKLNLTSIDECSGKQLLLLSVEPGPKGPYKRRVNWQEEHAKLTPIVSGKSPSEDWELPSPPSTSGDVAGYACIVGAKARKEALQDFTVEQLYERYPCHGNIIRKDGS